LFLPAQLAVEPPPRQIPVPLHRFRGNPESFSSVFDTTAAKGAYRTIRLLRGLSAAGDFRASCNAWGRFAELTARQMCGPSASRLWYSSAQMAWKNKLYFGDNLGILREHVATESVDLIYLDPPFNSSATYNVLFKEKSGEESAAQITAFERTWQWGLETEAAYKGIVAGGLGAPRRIQTAMGNRKMRAPQR
jgi:hypothetical protein